MPEPQAEGNRHVTRVTVWNEFVHERRDDAVRAIYPDGMHDVVGAALERYLGDAVSVRFATLDQPDHGLADDVLEETDVLTWWGHCAHDRGLRRSGRPRRQARLAGHGPGPHALGPLLKGFQAGSWAPGAVFAGATPRTGSSFGRSTRVTLYARVCPSPIVIPRQEMYGEFFDIPQPDELVFISSFTGGEVFRSGCCFTRGRGRIFYFSPGDQEYPVYHNEAVTRVIANAVQWCTPSRRTTDALCRRPTRRMAGSRESGASRAFSGSSRTAR